MEKLLERPLSALDAIYTRRSVRSYTSQRIDPSTVRALLDSAVQAPTAMLEQPWSFVVVQDPDVLRRLPDRAKAMWVGEAAPPPELHLADELGIHRDLVERLADPEFDVFHHAPTLIVICARRTDRFKKHYSLAMRAPDAAAFAAFVRDTARPFPVNYARIKSYNLGLVTKPTGEAATA